MDPPGTESQGGNKSSACCLKLPVCPKSAAAGVDAIVAEGFEAGGHNGREETTTLTLIPQVRGGAVDLPLIAAGGIASGEAMAAAFALGAEGGVQSGTRFALTYESSASDAFKEKCITLDEGDTMLSLKKVSPTRIIKNDFYRQVQEMEDRGGHRGRITATPWQGGSFQKKVFLKVISTKAS